MVCASNYALLGSFPKRGDYTSYKCTQQPCNVEIASVKVFNSTGDVVAKLSSEENEYTIGLKNNRLYFPLYRITQAICVPKSQLNHWEVKSWYDFS